MRVRVRVRVIIRVRVRWGNSFPHTYACKAGNPIITLTLNETLIRLPALTLLI